MSAQKHESNEERSDHFARRTVYFLVMSAGAFFAYFNDEFGWLTTPDYERIKGRWLDPIMPTLEPYLPNIVLFLGILFLLLAAYNYRVCIKR
jgi:hypothetical protein